VFVTGFAKCLIVSDVILSAFALWLDVVFCEEDFAVCCVGIEVYVGSGFVFVVLFNCEELGV